MVPIHRTSIIRTTDAPRPHVASAGEDSGTAKNIQMPGPLGGQLSPQM